LKNSTCRNLFLAWANVLYAPNFRPVFSLNTTYNPLIFFIMYKSTTKLEPILNRISAPRSSGARDPDTSRALRGWDLNALAAREGGGWGEEFPRRPRSARL